ncbi:TetR/AcrR family transcriptional regulator [Streptomonospora wellingtoniae]|uniref:TetR/AcrR family transcriptional regulator n=1 Tax=Streptomonospora wellingtoniae TaxID=3075544 RepID=UPI00288A5BA9|nr:TetR/AcrR family transcriptional regulator [Streptomonospora sp. DSM 45055]
MGPTSGAPGRPRSTEADTAILDAALDLLVERGIGAISIEQVAQRAGVTRATVYRRYADRTELLIAAIHHDHDAAPDELPEPDDVEQLLSWWAQALGTPAAGRGWPLIRRLMTELYDHPELAEAFTEVSVEPRNRWIRAALIRDRDRGRFPADADLGVVQQIITGAVVTHLLTRPDGTTAHEIEDYLLAVLRETRYRRNP